MKTFLQILDPLYGDLNFDPVIADLIRQPLMQRLRQIRLSNIDSIQMPGISGITRYEHALGVTHLAANVGFAAGFPEGDRHLLQAAALIHDTAITPFGHLVEEALQYVSSDFHHEAKWALLMSGTESSTELGGINLQLYLGHDSGLSKWAAKNYLGDAPGKLKVMLETIQGRGVFGPCIAGTLDLDNLDNVTRMAFHMGLRPDIDLPLRLSRTMLGLTPSGDLIFDLHALEDIKQWSVLRHSVYDRLMPCETDFVGKIMLLFSAVCAFQTDDLRTSTSWMLTDNDFVSALRNSATEVVRNTVERWLLGDVWELSDRFWLEDNAPSLSELKRFSERVSQVIEKPCFCYRIKDKRDRKIEVNLSDGTRTVVGRNSSKWILGVGTPTRKPFTSEENKKIIRLAQESFDTTSTSSNLSTGNLF